MSYELPPGAPSPPDGIHEDGDMDDEQRRIAAEFVDELVELGVFRKPPPHRTVLTSVPMFVVDNERQPGQWRVMANMLQGGEGGAERLYRC
jgi:hypothetical protein